MNKTRIDTYRKEYSLDTLDESSVAKDPLIQFEQWFKDAEKDHAGEPNIMSLSTVDSNHQPSSRIVLLKDYSPEGFCWYTNYDSKKGVELAQNNKAALLFFWESMERQVRIEGTVSKVSAEESEAYFSSRPIGSQIGAISSPQSKTIGSREELESNYKKAEKAPLKRPAHWGGYMLRPSYYEFWQGRPSRLHDRIAYQKKARQWIVTRLAP